jgi:hypothetical protein
MFIWGVKDLLYYLLSQTVVHSPPAEVAVHQPGLVSAAGDVVHHVEGVVGCGGGTVERVAFDLRRPHVEP